MIDRKKFFNYYLSFILICAMLMIPSILAWFRSPLLITPYEFDFFLGFLGSDYENKTVDILLIGKWIHFIGFSIVGYLFFKLIHILSKNDSLLTTKDVAIISILSATIFSIGHSWLSPDIFYYLGLGWLESHYQMNPYLTKISSINNFQNDPLFTNIFPAWVNLTCPYGPLSQKLFFIISKLSSGNIVWALIYSKLFYFVLHLGNLIVIRKICLNLKFKPNTTVVFIALNPLYLFCYLTCNHNDLFVISTIILSIFFITQNYNILTVIILGIGVNFKYIPILFFPIYALYLSRKKPAIINLLLLIMLFLLISIAPNSLYENSVDNFNKIISQKFLLNKNFITFYIQHGFNVSLETIRLVMKIIFLMIAACIWIYHFINLKKFNFEKMLKSCFFLLLIYFLVGTTHINEWLLPCLIPFSMLINDYRFNKFSLLISGGLLPIKIFEINSPIPYGIIALATYTILLYFFAYYSFIKTKKDRSILAVHDVGN